MLRFCMMLICGIVIVASASAPVDAKAFDKTQWLEDFGQVRQAFATRYANLELAQFDNANRLSDLLDKTRDRIDRAGSDADARAAFDRLTQRLGDGHVHFDWPTAASSADLRPGTADPCRNFNPRQAALPLMVHAAGYKPLETPQSAIFPAGTLTVDGHTVGVIAIGLIGAGARPELCRQAVAALHLAPGSPCDGGCQDRIDRSANARYTEAFAAQIVAVKAAGATALLVDIAGNGGGNEWADAAARMLTTKRLVSERMSFVRGEQWTKNLLALEATFRRDADGAAGPDRTMLLTFADQAHAKAMVAATPCGSEPLFLGHRPDCTWLGAGFFVSGPLAAAHPQTLKEKQWAEDVFIPMKYPYEEGVWRGPLIVLIDDDTASSAEAFTAVLQDNHAALVIGTVSAGAGCGHTDGGEPIKLRHSGAVLALPDCVYLRADGTNEVRGVVPDLLIGLRHSDNARHRSADVAERLPEALRLVSAPSR